MEIIADTNVVAAAVIRKGLTRDLLFNPEFVPFSPDRLAAELFSHEKEFLEKSGLLSEQFQQATALVLSRITILPLESYAAHAAAAKEAAPDPEDWPFFAAALHKNCGLWSNDKKLRQQNKVKIFSTEELLEFLRR